MNGRVKVSSFSATGAITPFLGVDVVRICKRLHCTPTSHISGAAWTPMTMQVHITIIDNINWFLPN